MAPLWMAVAAFFAAVAGVLWYLLVGSLVHAIPMDVPDALQMPLYYLYMVSPLFIAIIFLGKISGVLYHHARVSALAPVLHLWHCVLLYPLVAWTFFLIATCSGDVAPVRGACADPLGMTLAAGAVALGGILADAYAAFQMRRRFVPAAG